MASILLEYDQIFCANEDCELHVSPTAPNVRGRGNWATRSDGALVGRSIYNGKMYCDLCGQVSNKSQDGLVVGQ